MARRISGVGWVTVSLRRSTKPAGLPAVALLFADLLSGCISAGFGFPMTRRSDDPMTRSPPCLRVSVVDFDLVVIFFTPEFRPVPSHDPRSIFRKLHWRAAG